MIIAFLGWLTLIVVVLCLMYWFYCEVRYGIDCYKQKLRWEGVKKFAQENRQHSHWLDSEERKAFREFYIHIFNRMKINYHLSGEDLRNKVDQILKENK